jgi:hypothetical protein
MFSLFSEFTFFKLEIFFVYIFLFFSIFYSHFEWLMSEYDCGVISSKLLEILHTNFYYVYAGDKINKIKHQPHFLTFI